MYVRNSVLCRVAVFQGRCHDELLYLLADSPRKYLSEIKSEVA